MRIVSQAGHDKGLGRAIERVCIRSSIAGISGLDQAESFHDPDFVRPLLAIEIVKEAERFH